MRLLELSPPVEDRLAGDGSHFRFGQKIGFPLLVSPMMLTFFTTNFTGDQLTNLASATSNHHALDLAVRLI